MRNHAAGTARFVARTCFSIGAVVLAVACSDAVAPPLKTPVGPALDLSSGIPGGYVVTPAGLYHRSCVHQIPDAAIVDANNIVRPVTGPSYELPKCLFPIYSSIPGRGSRKPVVNNWVEDARLETFGSNFKRITADWSVPPTPIGVYSGTNKLYYTFPGLMSDSYINQPVIQYGRNLYYGGAYWTMTSWHCNDGSSCAYNGPVTVSSGDAIHGDVTASNCTGGNCTWTITNTDVTTSQQTVLTIVDTENYWRSTGGAVEVANLTSCYDFPSYTDPTRSGVFYSGIALYNNTFNQITPSWTAVYQYPTPSPSCHYNVTFSPTNVNLYHVPDLYAFISGPQTLTLHQSAQYTATEYYGTAPYTYQWSSRYNYGAWSNWSSTGSQNYTYASVNSCGISSMDLQAMITAGDGQIATSTYYHIGISNPC